MPQYFFHSQTHIPFFDTDGHECDDDEAASHLALALLGELLRDTPAKFWNTRPWTVRVADATEAVLFEISTNAVATPIAGFPLTSTPR